MIDLPIEAKHAIKARAEGILDEMLFKIEHGEIQDIDDCNAFIDDTDNDDAAAMHLDLDDQLTLVELHAEDHGLEISGSIEDIRTKIETFAAYLVCTLAESEARTAVHNLETFLDENEFEFEEIASSNAYGWARHYAEREEDGCQVYEYRNVEGEIHVDVWEYVVTPRVRVYLRRFLDAEDVTPEERVFDAV